MKTAGTRSMSVRVPTDVYEDIVALADALGVDVSAVVNWCLTTLRPTMVRRRLRLEHSLRRARDLATREAA